MVSMRKEIKIYRGLLKDISREIRGPSADRVASALKVCPDVLRSIARSQYVNKSIRDLKRRNLRIMKMDFLAPSRP